MTANKALRASLRLSPFSCGMGVPARIVTGYQGGDRNSVDNYWTVRNSDAHAWTEIWIADQGWVRIDPRSGLSRPGRSVPAPERPRRSLCQRRWQFHEPQHAATTAGRMGGRQQPLEPVGHQLHTKPPAQSAAKPGL
ncbi:transglutaminase family protein [Staphylococcus epidermidis]|nr:transglutaminase family protein [Staphylococcus epidermidis]